MQAVGCAMFGEEDPLSDRLRPCLRVVASAFWGAVDAVRLVSRCDSVIQASSGRCRYYPTTPLGFISIHLERAVGRSSGCVPRGLQQGTTRRNSRSIPTSYNEAVRRAGHALAAVATSTERVTIGRRLNLNRHRQLHTSRSGQLLFLVQGQIHPATSRQRVSC